MPTQNEHDRNSDPAEGSREALNFDDRDTRERYRDANPGPGREQSGGITNRPLDEELDNQRDVPDRGSSKTDEAQR